MPKPPSKKQLGYLKGLGYQGEAPETSLEASVLIDDLKAGARSDRAEKRMVTKRSEQLRSSIERVKQYLKSVAEMDCEYRDATGDPYVSGFRLKVPASEQTAENEMYHKAFLPLELALKYPQILAIEGIQEEELKRVPLAGLFVIAPNRVVLRSKGQPIPGQKGSGCASALLVIGMATLLCLLLQLHWPC